MNVYDFNVLDSQGNKVELKQYLGKVLLIVNTATGCGFTPQYEGLEKLYQELKPQGLEILDFPCNQFLNQAPGTNKEIVEFCQLNYGVTFKTFGKIAVNGKNADPLYVYLRKEKPLSEPVKGKGLIKKIFFGSKIEWNFTKFLIDKNGNVIKRFSPTVTPDQLIEDIKSLL
ncbi:MAG: glutathione peroxidase [Tenericutes bacterium HGW-Tenericutes-1]|jgi:glutathione peroxidase|nr:MAG: glutathione peroxidase [Tenericutes bacterium HGW-Tenericutes-1]